MGLPLAQAVVGDDAQPRVPWQNPASIGARARTASDNIAAGSMDTMARALRPGVRARVHRIYPDWCAGHINDFVLTDGKLSELYDYLRDNYGGARYRIEILHGTTDQVAFTSELRVSAPPMDQGERIYRAEWLGETPAPSVRPERPSSAEPARMNSDIEWLRLLDAAQQRAATAHEQSLQRIVDGLRESMQRSEENVHRVLETLSRERTETARAVSAPSLSAQLSELVSGTQAIRQVAKSLAPQGTKQGKTEDKGVLQGALDEAAKGFLSNAVGSFFAPKGERSPGMPEPRARRAQAPAQAPANGTNGTQYSGLPIARSTGHAA